MPPAARYAQSRSAQGLSPGLYPGVPPGVLAAAGASCGPMRSSMRSSSSRLCEEYSSSIVKHCKDIIHTGTHWSATSSGADVRAKGGESS